MARKSRRQDEKARKGNLPVQLKIGEAELELQKEVDKILHEAGVNEAKGDEGNEEDKTTNNVSPISSHSKSVRFSNPPPQTSSSQLPLQQSAPARRVQDFRGSSYSSKSANFANYRELRDAEVPKPQLPDELKSSYLNEEKTHQIWSWLNWDFKKTKFEHFLEVCS